MWWDRRIRTSEIWDEVIEALGTSKSWLWSDQDIREVSMVKNEAREGLKRSAISGDAL